VKTSEGYCLPSLESFSGEYSTTWSLWGIAWDGVCTELRTSELSIGGSEFLSLPTPRANNAMATSLDSENLRNHPHPNLEVVISRQMLPTPKASDGTMGAIIGEKDVFVQGPTGSFTKTAKTGESGGVSLPVTLMLNMKISGEEIGGPGTSNQSSMKPKLNPEFVERMMGFPTGWTDCEP
jgi:hypothetical protein